MKKERIAEVSRQTKETDVSVRLNLDGKGSSQISTGIHFFDHMLILLAKHGFFDLEVNNYYLLVYLIWLDIFHLAYDL